MGDRIRHNGQPLVIPASPPRPNQIATPWADERMTIKAGASDLANRDGARLRRAVERLSDVGAKGRVGWSVGSTSASGIVSASASRIVPF